MNELHTAFCGIECSTCPIFLATFEQDKIQQQIIRESVAKQCSELYGMGMKPEDITDCDGCRANTGRIFSGCVNCGIRKCVQLKGFESCAFCLESNSCGMLSKIHEHDPEAKKRLDEIRSTVH